MPRSPTSDIAESRSIPPVTSTVMPGASASAVATSSPFVTTTSSRLRAQLEREVVGGRARVERDCLALVDHRRGSARDRALALDLEAQPQVEADLRLPRLSARTPPRTRATSPCCASVVRSLRTVTSETEKASASSATVNGIAGLEQLQAPAASALAAQITRIRVRRRCARPYARSARKSIAHVTLTKRDQIESRFAICVAYASDSRPMDDDAVLERLRRARDRDPFLGLRQLGHALPRLPVARRRPHRLGADRRRSTRPRADRLLPERRAAYPVGRGRRLGELLPTTRRAQGIRIGAINPNLFGDDAYRLGSLCHPDAAVRAASARALPRVRRDRASSSARRSISLWLADGTNYPGQDDLRGRHARLVDGLEELYALLPPDQRLLVEYKFFEPGFYSTDLPDWGTAALVCRRLGPQAQVLVDTGHHPQGTNVEQIVALLLAEGLLGGFHFNNRKYADDDLIVGSIDPFELFRIMREIALGGAPSDVAFMIDQSHNVEGKIDAMIQSVMNIQTAYAKALLVDETRLAAAQARGDVLGAHRVLLEAFETDVRPLLRAAAAKTLASKPDPVAGVPRAAGTQSAARASAARLVESAYEQAVTDAPSEDR